MYVLLCTTKYYSSTTLYHKVLRQYYSVLTSTILYYKAPQNITLHYKVPQSTTPYYKVHTSTTLYHKVLQKYHSSTALHYKVHRSRVQSGQKRPFYHSFPP